MQVGNARRDILRHYVNYYLTCRSTCSPQKNIHVVKSFTYAEKNTRTRTHTHNATNHVILNSIFHTFFSRSSRRYTRAHTCNIYRYTISCTHGTFRPFNGAS